MTDRYEKIRWCLLLCEIVVKCEQVNQLARSRP